MILNDWCCLVIQDCGVIYVREKKRLVKEIDNMRSWDGTVRSTRILISRKQLREATIVGVGLICLLLFVYRYILFDKWNYSYANCLYRWLPFSSSGVETKGYCYSDISDNVLPIAYTSLHKGIFSFWLPQFSIGAPQGINLYFSVLNYLYLLPFGIAMPLIAVTKVVVAFLGVYCFARRIGCGIQGGFLAGTTYSLSSAMVTWQGWPHTEVGMYAPWLFLVIDLLLENIRIRYLVAIAMLTFLMFMAGMPTFAAYFMYLAAAYAVFYVCRRYWGEWKRLFITAGVGIGSVVVGVLMAFPYLGGLLASVGSNGYAESRSSWSSIGLGWPQLKTLFFPFMSTTATLNNIESMLYTGILAVITLGYAAVNFKKKKRVGFFLISMAVVLLLLFTPVLDPIFTHMPMVNTSYEFRIVILLNFSLAMLLGINMNDLLVRPLRTVREKVVLWIPAVVGLIVFVAVLLRTRGVSLADEQIGEFQRRITCCVVALFFVVLIFRTITFKRGQTVVSFICSIAICGGAVADTGYFASQYLPLSAKGAPAIPQATATIRYLQRHTRNGEKIVAKDVDFPVDSPMFYGLRDIRGHGLSMTNPDIKAYYEAIDASAYDASPTNTVFQNVENENLLRYAGVKYIVSSDRMESNPETSSGNGMKQVGDDGLLVKELDHVAPNVQLGSNVQVYRTNKQVLRAMGNSYIGNTVFFSKEFGIPDGAETSMKSDTDDDTTIGIEKIMEADNGSMTISVDTSATKYLVINEYDDGNWVAQIDGKQSTIYKGNGVFRAVEVPAGKHTITLEYYPKQTYRFLIVMGLGTLILLVVVVFCKKENEWFEGLESVKY